MTTSQPALSERECTTAVFIAVCALAEKLTGLKLEVRVKTEAGEVWVGGGGARWVDEFPASPYDPNNRGAG